MPNTYVRGGIGYTILINKDMKVKIMLIADMHSINEQCGDIFISDWLKKQKNMKLLLEEVPPSDINLKELWSEADHTQKLRELYIKNLDKIIGLDIRGELVKFSWELLKDMYFPAITLKEYLKDLESFFNLSHPFFKTHISTVYNQRILNNKKLELTKQYNYCLKQFNKFKNNNLDKMNITIQEIYQNNKDILEPINYLLNCIMEFYTVMHIFNCVSNGVNRFIIHKGLYHTSKLIKWLREIYGFEIVEEIGLTLYENVDLVEHNGCIKIPNI
jgi:hypothetical protein